MALSDCKRARNALLIIQMSHRDNGGETRRSNQRPRACFQDPMESRPPVSILWAMKLTRFIAAFVVLSAACQCCLQAQSPFLYHVTLQGTIYQTNSSGNFVATPITDKILVQNAAQAGGVSPSSIEIGRASCRERVSIRVGR